MALHLEHMGAPVALFFAGRRGCVQLRMRGPESSQGSAAQPDQPWSATAGHSVHALGNPVLIFCAISAWSVALVLLIGLVVPGTDKAGLAIIGFIGLGVHRGCAGGGGQTPQKTEQGVGERAGSHNGGAPGRSAGHHPGRVAPIASDEASSRRLPAVVGIPDGIFAATPLRHLGAVIVVGPGGEMSCPSIPADPTVGDHTSATPSPDKEPSGATGPTSHGTRSSPT